MSDLSQKLWQLSIDIEQCSTSDARMAMQDLSIEYGDELEQANKDKRELAEALSNTLDSFERLVKDVHGINKLSDPSELLKSIKERKELANKYLKDL